jgi:negative regulator of sigma-B (phosphoserine phosphatase)
VPKQGERANGDRCVIRQGQDGRTLLGIVDALGHGPGAEEVSVAALELLATAPADLGVGDLMEHLHARLRGTRGAAATICLVAEGKLEACGVGNVELRCTETEIPFIFSPGILGVRVQRFRVCSAKTVPDSRLIFFSDGIHLVNRLEDLRRLSPADACQAILRKHRLSEDDATVLIADLG